MLKKNKKELLIEYNIKKCYTTWGVYFGGDDIMNFYKALKISTELYKKRVVNIYSFSNI